jgi:tRNA wybutosine-synthesizing protein 1
MCNFSWQADDAMRTDLTFVTPLRQFPDAIKKLPPITQLYVSIDAGNKKDLQAVDRPLFADFWERFLACLDMLRAKEQRTVYRVTLMKGYNMHLIEEYAELVARGKPTFIEIKGVTFCGDSVSQSPDTSSRHSTLRLIYPCLRIVALVATVLWLCTDSCMCVGCLPARCCHTAVV